MGLISKILSFSRTTRTNGAKVSDVKTNPGGGANLTLEHFSAPGDDSHPLPGDYVASQKTPGSGRGAAVGYIDPKNTPLATAGEKRIYSRDSNGDVKSSVWLKSDGTIIAETGLVSLTLNSDGTAALTNGTGTAQMLADGSVDINGLVISPAGAMATAAGPDYDSHVHAQGADSDGDTQQNTGAPQ